MAKQHFDLNDDFEAIIKTQLRNVAEICKIPTGWTNYVYKATTQKGASYIFRFPRHDFWVESLKKEVWFNKFIKDKTKFKTVNIKYKKFDGRGYGVHRFVKGITMAEGYQQMATKQKQILARDITNYILSLQAVDVREIDLPTFSEFHIGLADVNGDEKYNYMEIFKPLFDKEKDKKKLVLVHGDFNPGNILVNKKFKMIGVLDYAFASVSAGPADLAVLLTRPPYRTDFYNYMIAEYEKASKKKVDKKMLDEFIKARVEIEADYVKYMARCHKDVVLPEVAF